LQPQTKSKQKPEPQPVASDPFKLLPDLPRRVTRARAAKLLAQHFFEVSPRSLERWPMPVTILNGRAHVETRALFEEARRREIAAATIAGPST